MNVKEIKNLPAQFNFKSNINHLDIVYHAKRERQNCVITWEDGFGHEYREVVSITEMHRHLLYDEYRIC